MMMISDGLSAVDAVQYDRNRAAVLEYLYRLDGRDDPSHPLANVYTGLAEQFRMATGTLILEELTRTWHDPARRDALFDVSDAGEP